MLSDLVTVCRVIEHNWEWIALIAAACSMVIISLNGALTAHLINIRKELQKSRSTDKENI